MIDLDTTNADSYGTCEIDYTGIINLFFANNQDVSTFNWVSGYNDIPSYVDHSNAIGRFKHNSFNGEISYIWYSCNNSVELQRINTMEAVIGSCENIDWRLYTAQFYAMGIDPLPVYIND